MNHEQMIARVSKQAETCLKNSCTEQFLFITAAFRLAVPPASKGRWDSPEANVVYV